MQNNNDFFDNELSDDEILDVDNAVLKFIGEKEVELDDFSEFDEEILSTSIRRLYLAGKIKKRKDGKQIFYRKNNEKTEKQADSEEQTINDKKNVSQIARKFRSCRYKVERNHVFKNEFRCTLLIEKKGKSYSLLYVPSLEEYDQSIFPKMLDNDSGIRIVTADTTTKLAVAKAFNDFIMQKYNEENGLLSFNQEHSFRVLTVEQFFHKTTWKTLLR